MDKEVAANASVEARPLRFYWAVWAALIAVTGIELLVTYLHPPAIELTGILLALAFVQGGTVFMFVMRPKYERARLYFGLGSAFVFVLLLIGYIWSDAFRAVHLQIFSR